MPILSGIDSRKDVIPRFYLEKNRKKDGKCRSYTSSSGALYACFLLFGGGVGGGGERVRSCEAETDQTSAGSGCMLPWEIFKITLSQTIVRAF